MIEEGIAEEKKRNPGEKAKTKKGERKCQRKRRRRRKKERGIEGDRTEEIRRETVGKKVWKGKKTKERGKKVLK